MMSMGCFLYCFRSPSERAMYLEAANSQQLLELELSKLQLRGVLLHSVTGLCQRNQLRADPFELCKQARMCQPAESMWLQDGTAKLSGSC